MMLQSVKLPQMNCPKCNHVWIPRVPAPKKCPRCYYRLKYITVEVETTLNVKTEIKEVVKIVEEQNCTVTNVVNNSMYNCKTHLWLIRAEVDRPP